MLFLGLGSVDVCEVDVPREGMLDSRGWTPGACRAGDSLLLPKGSQTMVPLLPGSQSGS